jgi:nickel superoxide dismutase
MGEHKVKNINIHATLACGLLLLAAAPTILGHCQIPCGIYDDPARFTEMREHVITIEKSMNQISALGAAESMDWNQLVRWVMNKEEHADELAHIVTYYFMAQRIKTPPGDADDAVKQKYSKQIALLHRMLVTSMKAKQSIDLGQVKALGKLIDEFEKSYMAK